MLHIRFIVCFFIQKLCLYSKAGLQGTLRQEDNLWPVKGLISRAGMVSICPLLTKKTLNSNKPNPCIIWARDIPVTVIADTVKPVFNGQVP